MKSIIITLAVAFLASTSLRAQSSSEFGIEVQAGLGTGLAYIFEDWIETLSTTFTPPVAVFAGAKLALPNSEWGFHARLFYMNTQISGKNWMNGYGTFNGDVTTISVFALSEYLHRYEESVVSLGVAFGLGFSDETIVPDRTYFSNPRKRAFLSAALFPVAAFHLTDRLSLRLEPSLYWNDPVNSIRVLTGALVGNNGGDSVAGADVSFLCLVGVSYRIK